jgi:ATP synthase protein I
MTQPNGDQEDRELKARLEKLSVALKGKRSDPQGAAQGESEASVTRTGQAMSLGFRVLAEFVAGVIVGGVIGWQADLWLGTTPFGLIVFLALGTAAGFWNVYKLAATTSSR